MIGNRNTWGWVVLCVGVVEWRVGLGVFVKALYGRDRDRSQWDRSAADDAGVSVLVAVDPPRSTCWPSTV